MVNQPRRVMIVCAVSTPEQAKHDKESLPAQEAELTAIFSGPEWEIIDIIRIPGFRRSFFTLREMVEAANKKEIYGPQQLENHIIAADFDVMGVRSTNRFNREQSLNAEVIGKVVRLCKAEIYSVMDGWIGRQNQRAMTAITGFRDSSELDELVKKRAIGIVGRLKRGLPISGKLPFSHHIIRDPKTGKDIRADINEDMRPLFNDIATLLLEQVAYDRMEVELFTRYHHVKPSGKPYITRVIYKFLLSPYTWGNNIIRWKGQSKPGSVGLWAFDSATPPPDGVSLVYGTHPPVYTGELADKIQAELLRRASVSNRASLKIDVKMFAGLVVCNLCGWRYGYNITKNHYGTVYKYMRCHKADRFGYEQCTSAGQVNESEVRSFLHNHLKDALETGHSTFDNVSANINIERELAMLRGSAKKLEHKLDMLMEELSEADVDLKADYRRKIRNTKDDLMQALEQAAGLESKVSQHQNANAAREEVIAYIRAIGLDNFWLLPAADINRYLRMYMPDYRVAAQNGSILGFTSLTIINQGRRRKLA